MALRLGQALLRNVGELRYEPTAKRVRAEIGGRTVLATSRARLVWEPGRVVPYYAVPEEDLSVALEPAPDAVIVEPAFISLPDGARIVEPGRFDYHTVEGEVLTLRTDGAERVGAAFRPAGPDLAGTSYSTSTPSTRGSRRTSRSSPTRATRSAASTSDAVRGP